ncbi:flavin reductase family protein [Halomonas urmiana]|uniref:Flavin reductase family protein n=1 Tax=Halomonas urmiana TaxID=490901 RepID=A0A5R8MLL4_9GAMM|nr:flavin reductase family protein [Halomonas urmiana]TLF53060.1 flavin reductase family protein [Halomonas urmiana]
MTTLTASPRAEATPAIDGRALRDTLGRFATGVTIVTARTEEGAPVGITANSFSSLSLDPPLILWSLALTSPSLPAFAEGRAFAVNILGHHQDALAMQFARPSDDKFEGVAHGDNAAGVPLLDGALARLECRVEFTRIAGDHLLIVGRVQAFATEEGEPLLFYQGGFQRLSA